MARPAHVLVLLATLLLAAGSALGDGAPVTVMPAGTQEPQLAISHEGRVHVVAAKGNEILFATSPDGRTFTAPVRVAQVPSLQLGMRRGPRIAATPGALVITAIAKTSPSDKTVELLAWRSTDGGQQWSGPKRINGTPGSAIEGLQNLATGPGERVACVWLDLRSGSMELYVAVSNDGGASWTESLAYRSPDGPVCECCHPSIAWSEKGDLVVMWRNWVGGARDLWFARSKDGGKTFPGPQKLGTGTWPLRACPMDGGGVAINAEGEIGTIWRRKSEVFFASPGTEERLLAEGAQGQIASGPRGFYLVWLEKTGGDVFGLSPNGTSPECIGTKAQNPSIASGLGGAAPVVASWATPEGVVVKVVAPRK